MFVHFYSCSCLFLKTKVDAFDLGEKNLEQLIAQFKEHNFVPERIKAQFSGLPLASIE